MSIVNKSYKHNTSSPSILVRGRSSSPYTKALDANTGNTSLTVPSIVTEASEPTAYHIKNEAAVHIMFFGTDAENETANYQIIGYTLFNKTTTREQAFIPQVLASGVVTLGAKTLGSTGTVVGTAASLWVDTITDTSGLLLSNVYSPGSDGVARLDIDVTNMHMLRIEIDRDDSATNISCIMQPGELSAMSETTAEAGNATSGKQDTQITSLQIMENWDESDRAKIVPSSGLPVYGTDITGANAYVTVATAPARICHYLHVACGDNGCIISCDGGTTEHFAVPANTERVFPGLTITSGATIQAKNLTTDANYTNVYISVW